MKIALPLFFSIAGVGGGIVFGHVLHNQESNKYKNCQESTEDLNKSTYISLDKNFIVPIVEGSSLKYVIVLSIAVEIKSNKESEFFQSEPKIRDRILNAIFRHAESGAFSGVFTTQNAMDDLRLSLTESAQSVVGDMVRDILVTDIYRKDL